MGKLGHIKLHGPRRGIFQAIFIFLAECPITEEEGEPLISTNQNQSTTNPDTLDVGGNFKFLLRATVPPCHRASVPPCHRATVPPCLRATVPPCHREGLSSCFMWQQGRVGRNRATSSPFPTTQPRCAPTNASIRARWVAGQVELESAAGSTTALTQPVNAITTFGILLASELGQPALLSHD
jgi:hypothetical protein